MFHNSRAANTGLRVVIAAATLAVLVGFARPTASGPVAAGRAAPTVMVRDFPGASSVTIIAWNPGAPAYGLRTDVPRTGGTWRYHWLYVATTSVPEREMSKVTGMNRSLKLEGSMKDDQNCFGGKGCAPSEYFSARVPDDVLRANLDNVSVKFLTNSGNELNYNIRRDVVDAYLVAVDSVRAALKKP